MLRPVGRPQSDVSDLLRFNREIFISDHPGTIQCVGEVGKVELWIDLARDLDNGFSVESAVTSQV